MYMNDERLQRGRAKLAEIDGKAGQAVIDSLAEVAPDLGRYIFEFAFGDIYSRPGLEAPQRQLVTLGALAAIGGTEPQLRVHVGAALNVGLSPQEVVEAIIHTVPYSGFPRALNAMGVVREVLAERGLLERCGKAIGGTSSTTDALS